MGLKPNKGTAPGTGQIKPSRHAQALLAEMGTLAHDQLPEQHTIDAIEGRRAAVPEPTRAAPSGEQSSAVQAPVEAPAAVAAPAAASAPDGRLVVELPVGSVRTSPFQPKGRPSVAAIDAVRRAISELGSLSTLLGPEGAVQFSAMDQEARRLAELAYDIQLHGVETPIEVRENEDGDLECLKGHRRLAATRLAGRETIPGLNRGPMSNAAAAATVLRGNLHRENFTPWQEAVLITDVQARRRADGYRDTVRTLATTMGWSHGKANMLLRIRQALSPEFLARVAKDGDVGALEDALSRASYRDLERLATESDDAKRLAATRRLLGLGELPAASPRTASAYQHRPKRGGGFILEVNTAVESMHASDAMTLREVLEAQLQRVSARIASLQRS